MRPTQAAGTARRWTRRGRGAVTIVAALSIVTFGGAAPGAAVPNEPTGSLGAEARAGDCRADGHVSTGAIFNNPHNDAADKIHEHIVCLIDGVPAGEEISTANYHFADKSVVEALKRAVIRGVDVKILLDRGVPDNSDDGPYYRQVKDMISDYPDSDSWIATCPGEARPGGEPSDDACIADRKMHNKLWTFSSSHGVPNVTFLTSSNLEDVNVDNNPDDPNKKNSGTFMWNSGYTAADDPELYDWFANNYFEDLAPADGSDPENLDYYEENHLPKQIGDYTVYHSPTHGTNIVRDILDKVECHGNTSGGAGADHRTIVRVSVLSISATSGVGTDLAEQLWKLDNQGCYVDIVANDIGYDNDHPSNDGPLRTLLKQPTGKYHGPEVREFNSGRPNGLHEKNLLIDGKFDGQINQQIVFTGSINFTRSSTGATGDGYHVNDETWLQINDPGVHARFRDNFDDIRHAAQTCWQTSKEAGCDGERGYDAPGSDLNCHETADKFDGAGNLYLYNGTYCSGANDAKANSGADRDHGDGAGQIKDFDNKADSIVNTTGSHIEFYNYPDYNAEHSEGDNFCVRPGQWVNQLSKYRDNDESWTNSISSHRKVNPGDCDRWFGGYHEPYATPR